MSTFDKWIYMCDSQMIKTYWVVWRSTKNLFQMIKHKWYQQLLEVFFKLIVVFPLISNFHQIYFNFIDICHSTNNWLSNTSVITLNTEAYCNSCIFCQFKMIIATQSSSALINPLRAKLFRRKKIHFVMSPHLHDTGSWNPSSGKTKTYIFYIVNTMAADDLVAQGARASATMIFTMLNRSNSIPAR